jgi:autotransporter passenger strand-loop-strand repeat protein
VVGTASGTTLGGFQIIFSGGTANGTNLTSIGYQYILPGGTASNTTVAPDAIQNDDGTGDNTRNTGRPSRGQRGLHRGRRGVYVCRPSKLRGSEWRRKKTNYKRR